MATAIQFPSTCKSCPTCGRKFVAARAGQDKKLSQDIARAESAIRACMRFLGYHAESESLRSACASEIVRLRRALLDHSLLWAIYRRSDKAAGYGIALVRS